MSTPTPRTDAAEFNGRDMGNDIDPPCFKCVEADFARELERELAESEKHRKLEITNANKAYADREAATRDNASLSERLTAAELERDRVGAELEARTEEVSELRRQLAFCKPTPLVLGEVADLKRELAEVSLERIKVIAHYNRLSSELAALQAWKREYDEAEPIRVEREHALRAELAAARRDIHRQSSRWNKTQLANLALASRIARFASRHLSPEQKSAVLQELPFPLRTAVAQIKTTDGLLKLAEHLRNGGKPE